MARNTSGHDNPGQSLFQGTDLTSIQVNNDFQDDEEEHLEMQRLQEELVKEIEEFNESEANMSVINSSHCSDNSDDEMARNTSGHDNPGQSLFQGTDLTSIQVNNDFQDDEEEHLEMQRLQEELVKEIEEFNESEANMSVINSSHCSDNSDDEMASFIKESFTINSKLTVHWDGKLMLDLTHLQYVDCLPVLVSGGDEIKLLSIKKLSCSTGEMQAQTVFDCLSEKEWNLYKNIVAMCFDTTFSNTGKNNGSCVLLEHKLGKNLFWLACRYHIFELVIGAAFQAVLPSATTGPDNRMFVRFRSSWSKIDHSAYVIANSAIIQRITENIR
ncbi:uncharacterized protein LOC126904038 [Daktulosphaira vitifoliae]|uniref:uncharacterized protein LOC126904038 n=1 Tax=Daktulosphaira vitifoliae TaxID=58002 RepID=UPI0021AABDD7|nr:uncharacterized protein LOC126904038 [Daktulosphaira vitifoliae]